MESRDTIVSRMIRAARLDPTLYREVSTDPAATRQALLIVFLLAVANSAAGTSGFFGAGLVQRVLIWPVFSVVILIVWTFISFLVARTLFSSSSSFVMMLRPLGFVNVIGILSVLSYIPGLGTILVLLVGIWMLVANVVAIREGAQISTGQAVLVLLMPLIVIFVLFLVGFVVVLFFR